MTVKLLVNCVVKNWFIRRGTSNLREHLNRIHKKEYHPSTHVANQRTIENSFFSFVCGSCPESRAKRISAHTNHFWANLAHASKHIKNYDV